MDVLTTEDIREMTDIVSSQGLSQTELRLFALNQTIDVAKVFIQTMRTRHNINVLC
jgi:hypothetical protein